MRVKYIWPLCSIVLLSASSAWPRHPAAWISRRSSKPIRMPSCACPSNPRLVCRISRRARLPLRLMSRQRSLPRAVKALKACYRAFRDLDATMVEVNPLVVTGDGRIIALDAKMGFDDNALFRRPQISELRDKSQEDSREMQAADPGSATSGSTVISAASSTVPGPRHGDHGHDQARRW